MILVEEYGRRQGEAADVVVAASRGRDDEETTSATGLVVMIHPSERDARLQATTTCSKRLHRARRDSGIVVEETIFNCVRINWLRLVPFIFRWWWASQQMARDS
jgi:hypothetical protein